MEILEIMGIMKLLLGSLLSSDLIILIFAMFTVIVMFIVVFWSLHIKKRKDEWLLQKNTPFTRFLLNGLGVSYNIFTTLITIFPLLGMLGTVFGLLGLNLAIDDMENIKNNFFIALTSTAWGIIFSIIFKLCNAVISNGVEEQIVFAKGLLDGKG